MRKSEFWRCIGIASVVAGWWLFAPANAEESVGLEYGLPIELPEKVGMSSERLSRIGPAIQRFVDEGQIAGALTVVARGGRVVHANAVGYDDVVAKTPWRGDTIFRFASMTKPVVAVAAMIAYEDGKFGLDDPVAKYLPEFESMKVYTGEGLVDAKNPITIRQLLTHTAGFTRHLARNPVAEMYREDDVIYFTSMSFPDYIKKLAEQPLIAQPGTTWDYSFSLDPMARIIEIVYNQNYESFLEQRLFVPLGMSDAGYVPDGGDLGRFARLYKLGEDGGLHLVADEDVESRKTLAKAHWAGIGTGGLLGTAADYLRFAQMLLNGGELDGVRILSPRSVDLILASHFHDVDAWVGQGRGFGLGGAVVVDPIASGYGWSKGTYGWGGAYGTSFWIDREQEIIGLVLAQRYGGFGLNHKELMVQMTYQALTDAGTSN